MEHYIERYLYSVIYKRRILIYQYEFMYFLKFSKYEDYLTCRKIKYKYFR